MRFKYHYIYLQLKESLSQQTYVLIVNYIFVFKYKRSSLIILQLSLIHVVKLFINIGICLESNENP